MLCTRVVDIAGGSASGSDISSMYKTTSSTQAAQLSGTATGYSNPGYMPHMMHQQQPLMPSHMGAGQVS